MPQITLRRPRFVLPAAAVTSVENHSVDRAYTSNAPATAPPWSGAATWPSTRTAGWSPTAWKPTGTTRCAPCRREDYEPAIAAAISLFMVFGHAAVYGPLAAFCAELFPANVRYSGVSIGYQAASILLGGLTPLIASSLLLWSGGDSWPIIAMVAGSALIAAVTLFLAPETRNRDLTAIDHKPKTAGIDSHSDASKEALS